MKFRLPTFLFLGLLFIFSATAPGGLGAPDANARFDTAKSWIEGNGGAIDESYIWKLGVPSQNGKVYAVYNPLQSVVMVFPILFSKAIFTDSVLQDKIARAILSILVFPLISATAVLLLFLSLMNFGVREKISFLSSLTYVFGTPFFAYARIAQEENLLSFSIALWLWGISLHQNQRHNWEKYGMAIATLGGCLAVLTKFSIVFVLMALLAISIHFLIKYPLRSWKFYIAPFVLCVVTLCFLGIYNKVRFGSFFESGYGLLFNHYNVRGFIVEQIPEIAAALLISSTRGLLLFCPLLPLWFWAARKTTSHQFSVIIRFSLIALFATWIWISGSPQWHSGFSWGPRYFVSSLTFIVFAFVLFFENSQGMFRKFGMILIFLSFFIQALSSIFPHSRESMIREVQYSTGRMECKSVWKFECSVIPLRIEGVLRVPGEIFKRFPTEAKSIPEILETSDFRVAFWWPIRLSLRWGVLGLNSAFIILFVMLSFGVSSLFVAQQLCHRAGAEVSLKAVDEEPL